MKRVCNRPAIICLLLMFCIGLKPVVCAQERDTTACDKICGKWMSDQKNLSVEVYKDGGDFKAKIIWFDDSDDKAHPMAVRKDISNPDKALRDRLILGMNVVEKLEYDAENHSWEKGIIYDASHGHYWDSSAYITPTGELKVTGYWHFKFIGKTLTFKRL